MLIVTLYTALCLVFSSTHHTELLRIIEGAHLVFNVKPHPALAPIMHLFPENILVSGDEDIPGLVPSPTGETKQTSNIHISIKEHSFTVMTEYGPLVSYHYHNF